MVPDMFREPPDPFGQSKLIRILCFHKEYSPIVNYCLYYWGFDVWHILDSENKQPKGKSDKPGQRQPCLRS